MPEINISGLCVTLPNGDFFRPESVTLGLDEVAVYLSTLTNIILDEANATNVKNTYNTDKQWHTLSLLNAAATIDKLDSKRYLELINYFKNICQIKWSIAKEYIESLHDEFHSDNPKTAKFMAIHDDDNQLVNDIKNQLEHFGFKVDIDKGDRDYYNYNWDFVIEN